MSRVAKFAWAVLSYKFLSSIVVDILGCPPEDPRVMRSVISVQTQAVAYLPNAVGAQRTPILWAKTASTA